MTGALVRRPVAVTMLLAAGCLLGAVSYGRLPVELIPFAELPMLVVQVQGARDSDPGQVESRAVIPIEGAIAGLPGIERIESFVEAWGARILVSYRSGVDPGHAYLRLEQRVGAAAAGLDDEIEVRVHKVDTGQLQRRFMSLEARGEGGLDRIRHVVDRKVVEELGQVDGVAEAAVYGGRRRSIEVRLDEQVLRGQGLTAAQVGARVAQGSRPRRHLGEVAGAGGRSFVSLVSDYTSPADLEETVLRGGLRLGQVASVVDGGAERESIARVNGLEAVTVSLMRDPEANLLEVSAAAAAVVERLNRQLAPEGVELVVSSDTAEPVRDNIGDIRSLALLGGGLAVAVLWIFLRNLVLVAVVALAIPVSVLISLNLFHALGLTLNSLSLVGLAVAVGMLIDNSIVVLESIYRRLARGEDADGAVAGGVADVRRAVVAATLTTVCVFLPFVFAEDHLIRLLGREVGVAVISTLLVSLAVALLLIPVVTWRLARGRGGGGLAFRTVSQRQRPVQVYSLLLKSCLRFPARTVIAAVAGFFLTLTVCLALSVGRSRPVELDRFDVYAGLPGGATLELADELALAMDERLARVEELEERRIDVKPDLLRLDLRLREDYRKIAGRGLAQVREDVSRELREAFPALWFTFDAPRGGGRFGGGGGGGGMEGAFGRLLGIGGGGERLVLRGRDMELMRRVADDLRFNLERLTAVEYAWAAEEPSQPEISLFLDRAALRHHGVTEEAVSGELAGFQPQVSSPARVRRGAEEVEVLLRSGEPGERRIEDLRRVQVPAEGGGSVPLPRLADLAYTSGSARIARVNQEKELQVRYRFQDEVRDSAGLLAEGRSAVDELASAVSPPSGVSVEVVRDETDLEPFYFLLAASVVLIYMILAAAFESLVAPLAMMITLPLATVGGLWGLVLTGNSVLDANALVGFVILLGVVVNNGIMLIDSARARQRRGARLPRALLQAGQARLRPIAITALSTILALLPLAMGKAEYVAVIGVPFAVAVIGGLLAGTLFTLVLVPAVYAGLENTLSWLRGLGGWTWAAQLAALALGAWLIHEHVDGLLWRAVDATALLGGVPALTWFLQTSLRRSRADPVPRGESLRISVANLVKVYDDEPRFLRQWRRGERQRARLRAAGEPEAAGPGPLRWQLPLLAFHFYFAYLYLDSDFWAMVFSVAFVLFLAAAVRPLLPPPEGRRQRLVRGLWSTVFWLLPVPHLLWYQQRWDNWALTILVGVLWYLGAAVHRGARRLYRGEVNVDGLAGRFRGIRRMLYRLVAALPLIGRRRRPFPALKQASVEIESGMFGLIGPNGAGKTTLMRVLCGILEPTRGKVRVNGIDLSARREELQALIGYLPQAFGTYENMTAYQFLDYQAMLKGRWDAGSRRRAVEEAIAAVHLEDSRDKKIGGFSGGMKQRVGIAQTLLHLPRILVVDEPTAGLDPRERIRFRNLLAELARDRVVVFSTHIIEDISSSCNRLAVLDGGEVRFLGTPQEMVDLTRGSVWQASVTEAGFEELRQSARIVHHMRDQDRIRVRLLAAERPLPGATEATPTLEDSYLWLLEEPAP